MEQRLEKDPGRKGQESVTLGDVSFGGSNTQHQDEPKRKQIPEYDDPPQLTDTEYSPITALRS